MPVLFSTVPGKVVQLLDPAAQCQTQFLSFGEDPDTGISDAVRFRTELSIITRVTFSQRVNVQFMHTLGAHVYIYVFGDRMGEITLSGLSANCACGVPGSGPEKMFLWYKDRRASNRRTPIKVSIGREVIEGFVVGFNEDAVDPSLMLVQWGVQMSTLPEI